MSLRRDNKTRPGQPFASASLDNEQRRLSMLRIKGGPGIRIRYESDSVVISADAVAAGGRGLPFLTSPTPPAVPNTPCLWFEVDEDGKPIKMYAALLEGETMAWACISHLEAEEEEE